MEPTAPELPRVQGHFVRVPRWHGQIVWCIMRCARIFCGAYCPVRLSIHREDPTGMAFTNARSRWLALRELLEVKNVLQTNATDFSMSSVAQGSEGQIEGREVLDVLSYCIAYQWRMQQFGSVMCLILISGKSLESQVHAICNSEISMC